MLKSQITGLEFLGKNTLVACTGPFIKVYDLESNSNTTIDLFSEHNCRITGIKKGKIALTVVSSDVLIVFGGKLVQVIRLKDDIKNPLNNRWKTERLFLLETSDWIMDASIISDFTEIALVYMHNFIEIYNIQNKSLILKNFCPENCILYCAKLFTKGDFVVACGTVFNQVLIWKPLENCVTGVLKGHQGVLFHVEWNCDGTRLLSCSDDRSIRLWDIASLSQVSVLYGHSARIWKCSFIDIPELNSEILSISEDATCRLWTTEKCVKVFGGHDTINIWSFAFNGSVIATGGGDGGIVLHNLTQKPAQEKISAKGQCIKNFCITNETICWISDGGQLVLESEYDYKVDAREFMHPQLILIQANECKYIILSSENGNLTVFKGSEINEYPFANGKLSWLDGFYSSDSIWLFGQSGCAKNVLICSVVNLNSMEIYSRQITLDRQYRITSADFIDGLLVLGCRSGSIQLFKATLTEFNRIFSRERFHGQDACTSVKIDGQTIHSCGRDGYYNQFQVASFTLVKRQKFQGKLEQLDLLDNQVLVSCIYNRYLQVYNATTEQLLVEFDTFKARKWIFKPKNALLTNALFAQIYKESLLLTRVASESKCLEQGSSGLELRVGRFLANSKIAIAGEDGKIRIFSTKTSNFNPRKLENHNSVIKGISTWQDFMFSCGAGAELNCWKLLNDQYYLFQSCLDYSELTNVRIMDVSCIFCEKLYVAAAYSDGFIRLFEFNDQFKLIKQISTNEKCALKVKLVVVASELVLVGGCTSGFLYIYYLSTDYLMNSRTNQSGINALDAVYNESLMIATGGDDNCLTFTEIQGNSIIKRVSNPNAHASNITGLRFVGSDLLVTASIDQRLKKWSIEFDEFILRDTRYLQVADVADLDFQLADSSNASTAKILVVGHGFQLITDFL